MSQKATGALQSRRRTKIGLGVLACTYLLYLSWGWRGASQKVEDAYVPALPGGLDALWILDSPYLPPFDASTGRFDFAARSCSTTNVMIDVGAHKEAETKNMEKDYVGGYTVLAFEPQLGFYSKLRDQGSCVFAIPAAVSSENGLMEMHISQNMHSSSLLKTNEKGMDTLDHIDDKGTSYKADVLSSRSYNVFTIALKEVIPRMGVARSPYLKIDAQGYDLEVVKSAGDWIRVFDYIKLEAKAQGTPGMYEGQPEPTEIEAYMKQHGFVLSKTLRACCLEVELEVDMHFVNEGFKHAKVSPDCPMGPGCKAPQ